MKYNDYTLKPVIHQGTICYRVIRPNGTVLSEIAANLKTAKKWADADRAERRSK